MSSDAAAVPRSRTQQAGLFAGPAVLTWLLMCPPGGLGAVAAHVLAVTAWVATWWLTEPVPSPITALLPAVLLPALGVMKATDVARAYQHDAFFLFLGGFLLALALEQSGLHRRMAGALLRTFGTRARRVVLGYYLTVTFISLWLNNSATTLMMLPSALALDAEARRHAPEDPRVARFGQALILGTAMCANIGGMGTPIGTMPNQILVGAMSGITFAGWMKVGLPLVAVLTAAFYLVVTFITARYPADLIIPLPKPGAGDDGRWTPAQKRIGALFGVTVVLWSWRADMPLGSLGTIPGWTTLLERAGLFTPVMKASIQDGTIAIASALMLFLLPGERRGRPLLDHASLSRVPWDVLMLLGSSFVLAEAYQLPLGGESLSASIAHGLAGLSNVPPYVRLLVVAIAVGMITEIASNTAVAALLIPIGIAMARATGEDPARLGFTICFSASCSFMLPVATPPNALVYGTGRVPLSLMIRSGFLLNIIGAVVVATLVWALV